MSNRNKKMKKNYMLTGKKAGFLAVAAMSAVLVIKVEPSEIFAML